LDEHGLGDESSGAELHSNAWVLMRVEERSIGGVGRGVVLHGKEPLGNGEAIRGYERSRNAKDRYRTSMMGIERHRQGEA